jgi:hypothetical protein
LSVLTKLFVVLLVVVSLLQSAAMVVYVNRSENFAANDKEQKRQIAAEKKQVADLNNTVGVLTQRNLDQATAASRNEGELQRALTDAGTKLQEKDNQIAQLTKDAQVGAATIKGTADALRASQEENKGYQTLVAELRNKNDDLLKQNGELNTQVTTYDNKLRAVDRAREYSEEKNVEKDNIIKRLQQGGASAAADRSDGASAPAGPINGVVRSVDIIGGKKYATISVGSADNVTKGMKFNVINKQSGDFLGFLTVESVEPNAAIGQVEGKVDKIQAGVEVKTQL